MGGAIACIGHIEKAFTSAFVTLGQARLLAYRNAMLSMLRGRPIVWRCAHARPCCPPPRRAYRHSRYGSRHKP